MTRIPGHCQLHSRRVSKTTEKRTWVSRAAFPVHGIEALNISITWVKKGRQWRSQVLTGGLEWCVNESRQVWCRNAGLCWERTVLFRDESVRVKGSLGAFEASQTHAAEA